MRIPYETQESKSVEHTGWTMYKYTFMSAQLTIPKNYHSIIFFFQVLASIV